MRLISRAGLAVGHFTFSGECKEINVNGSKTW